MLRLKGNSVYMSEPCRLRHIYTIGGSICEHKILQTYLLEGLTHCNPGILPRDHHMCNCYVQYCIQHFPETFLCMNI